jgi:hypothetical protein
MPADDWGDEPIEVFGYAPLTPLGDDALRLSKQRAVVFATSLERRAEWTEALLRRGFLPTPTGLPLEAVIVLSAGQVDVLVVDCGQGPFRLDAVGLARLALEESLAKEVIIDRRSRRGLPKELQSDPRVRGLSLGGPTAATESTSYLSSSIAR